MRLETIEVESGSHWSQAILLSACTWTKVPTFATQLWRLTGTSLSLMFTEHTLYRTVEKTFEIKN